MQTTNFLDFCIKKIEEIKGLRLNEIENTQENDPTILPGKELFKNNFENEGLSFIYLKCYECLVLFRTSLDIKNIYFENQDMISINNFIFSQLEYSDFNSYKENIIKNAVNFIYLLMTFYRVSLGNLVSNKKYAKTIEKVQNILKNYFFYTGLLVQFSNEDFKKIFEEISQKSLF